jgi:tetratricopeptide (TPR) repeat protein
MFRTWIGYGFSAVMFGLGYWSIVKDKNHQAWHDKIVSSYVVTKQKNLWILGLVLFLGVFALEVILLASAVTTFMHGPVVKQIQNNIQQTEKIKQLQKEQQTLYKYYPENYISKSFASKVNLIKTYNEKQQYSDMKAALATLEETASTREEKAVAANWMGIYLEQVKNYKDAERYYQKATEIYPDYATAYANLSMTQRYYLYKDEDAVKNAQISVKLTPQDAWSHYALGLALYDSGKKEEGIKELEKAVQLDPKDASYKKTLQEVSPVPTKQGSIQTTTQSKLTGMGYVVSPQTIHISVPAGQCVQAFTAKTEGAGKNVFRLSPYTISDPAIHWDSTEYQMQGPMTAGVGICVDSSFTNHNETRSATVTFIDRMSGATLPLNVTVTVP